MVRYSFKIHLSLIVNVLLESKVISKNANHLRIFFQLILIYIIDLILNYQYHIFPHFIGKVVFKKFPEILHKDFQQI
ncbi:hypothetical protein BpHYR1_009551 [Brachionus plicatilis]|uniref:Uncharacterized protein n=1 Tax=Brachionus plicatilis TaxID=10195 RepID=A0A3M7Q485_BRAPC|nr:hypothetical protein BpHYR1_009551 [Brachionus plicatilis]